MPQSYIGFQWFGVWDSDNGSLQGARFKGWIFMRGDYVRLIGTRLSMADAPRPTSTIFATPDGYIMHPTVRG